MEGTDFFSAWESDLCIPSKEGAQVVDNRGAPPPRIEHRVGDKGGIQDPVKGKLLFFGAFFDYLQ